MFARTNNERDEATRHNVRSGELFKAINLRLMLVTMTPASRTLDYPLFYDMKVSQI
jgi:hypothetical protein